MTDSRHRQKRSRAPANAPALHFEPACFQAALLDWYEGTRRELPWRALPLKTPDPYRVWLSEVMLQQTTVAAVLPYYAKFVERWPSIAELAAAPRDEVMAAWAGLGYYSRARNLHEAAGLLARDGFPRTEAGLRDLPGIGPYTGAAIAAIAFGAAAVAVDGNIERILSRLFAIETPLPAAKAELHAFASRLVSNARPGDYTQALMDLGQTICTPKRPSCSVCPVRAYCRAFARGEPELLPRKSAKPARPLRHGIAFVLMAREANSDFVLLRKRTDAGLLGGMMGVPVSAWEASPPVSPFGNAPAPGPWREAGTVRHAFTHFHLQLRVFAKMCGAPFAVEGAWARFDDLDCFALPAVMRKAIALGASAERSS